MSKEQTRNGDFSLDVVLVEPEIPQNTGNIARTCMTMNCRLHLIEPLGFSLEDRYLKRAGMDYWHHVDVTRHPNLEAFFAAHPEGPNCTYYFFSKKATTFCHQARFRGETFLFFGKETWGLPEELQAQYPQQCLRIPMQPEARSLNLANSVAIAVYEAHRQNGFTGLAGEPRGIAM